MSQLVQRLHQAFLDRRLGLLLVSGLVAAALGYRFSRLISHDIGWMLVSANQALDGDGRLYRDIFFEVNPPLALFLKFPAVLIARATGLFDVDVFLVFVFLLALASICLTARLMSRATEVDAITRRSVVLGVLLSLLLLPGPEFGQREHFLLIFCLPYLVLSALRSLNHHPRPALCLLAGTMAALGFVLKPHFLLLPILVEIYVVARTRKPTAVLRPETVAMGVTGVAYALAVLIVTPEYLSDVLPVVMAIYNDALRNPLSMVLTRFETFLVALAVTLHLIYRKHQVSAPLGDLFAIAALAFYAVYVIQMKGWHYHALPSLAAAICTLCIVVSGILGSAAGSEHRASQGRAASIIGVLCILLVAFVSAKGVQRHGTMSFFAQALVPIIERHAPGGMVYSLSTNVWTGFPAVNYSRARWASRYSMLWILPGVVGKQADAAPLEPSETEKLKGFETALRESVVEDLTRNRPDLIILDDREQKSYFGGLSFDYIEYFSSDPRFRRIWAEYDRVDRFGAFLVFKRRQAAAASEG